MYVQLELSSTLGEVDRFLEARSLTSMVGTSFRCLSQARRCEGQKEGGSIALL